MRWSRAAALMGLVAIGAGSPACGGAANDDQAASAGAPATATEAPPAPSPAETPEVKVAEGASSDTGPETVAPAPTAHYAVQPRASTSSTGKPSTGKPSTGKPSAGAASGAPTPRSVKLKEEIERSETIGPDETPPAPSPSSPPTPPAEATPEIAVTPEPVASPEPVVAPFDVDRFVASLPEGAIAFNAPDTVELDERVRVRLVVQPGASEAELKVEHAAGASPAEQGEVQTASTVIAPELEARLVSATLQVAALDPERQSVSANAPTEWRWDVVAREGGPQELALSLYAIPPDQGSVRRIKTFERAISVHVPLVKRVASLASDHLEWMWSLILAPVGGWLYTRFRKRHGDQAPPPGSVQGG